MYQESVGNALQIRQRLFVADIGLPFRLPEVITSGRQCPVQQQGVSLERVFVGNITPLVGNRGDIISAFRNVSLIQQQQSARRA